MSEVRIGVFVCHCGNNIGGVVNVPDVVAFARSLPEVVHAEDNIYSCSEAGLSSIKESIKKHGLSRVIVASCTPRTHEPLFKKACEEAGLNKYLFEFVNIREHCSWIHMQHKDDATEKAKFLVEMGVAKARFLEPQQEEESKVIPQALVIGGGVAGMTAALTIASQGIKVCLVEKENELGGRLNKIHSLFHTNQTPDEIVKPLVKAVRSSKNIRLYLSSEVTNVKGYIGAFHVTIDHKGRKGECDVGTILVAVGADVLAPKKLFRYGAFRNVITELELEDKLQKGFKPKKGAVFINCAGARIPQRPYCSRICCLTSIKNAYALKRRNPKAGVYVLHRDLMAYGADFERYYKLAQEAGVRFIRYDIDKPPKVSGKEKAEKVSVYHELLGKKVDLVCDLVVLTTPLIPGEDNEELSKMLKVPLSEEGFFLEAHLKLKPVEFATDGIYICGSARWPSDVRESISQGYAAASKALIPMKKGTIASEAITSFIDEMKCIGCGACVVTCPYSAIELITKEGRYISHINAVQCKGCGSCVAACLNGAAQQRCYTDQQLLEMVHVLLK